MPQDPFSFLEIMENSKDFEIGLLYLSVFITAEIKIERIKTFIY